MPFGVDHLFGDIPEFCLEVADLAFYLLRFLLMGDEAALFIRDLFSQLPGLLAHGAALDEGSEEMGVENLITFPFEVSHLLLGLRSYILRIDGKEPSGNEENRETEHFARATVCPNCGLQDRSWGNIFILHNLPSLAFDIDSEGGANGFDGYEEW